MRSQWNARWQAKNKKRNEAIVHEYNSYCKELNLPTISLSAERKHKCPFKGKKKPVYMPPPEKAKEMSEDEMMEWKRKARLKRKAISQRENRKAREEKIKKVVEELPLLKQMVEEKKMSGLDCKMESPVAQTQKNFVGNTKAGSFAQGVQLNQVVNANTSKNMPTDVEFGWDNSSWALDDVLSSSETIPDEDFMNVFDRKEALPSEIVVDHTNVKYNVNREMYAKPSAMIDNGMSANTYDSDFSYGDW